MNRIIAAIFALLAWAAFAQTPESTTSYATTATFNLRKSGVIVSKHKSLAEAEAAARARGAGTYTVTQPTATVVVRIVVPPPVVCVAPKVLQAGVCVDPPPPPVACVAPQILVSGVCTDPLPPPPTTAGKTLYVSPTGSDSAAGTQAAPLKTFAKAFASMAAGDELVLLDGTYTASTTGVTTWDAGAQSGQIPSGVSLAKPTIVRAANPGQVFVKGPLFVGRSARKDSYIVVDGITFDGGTLYNTSYVTVRNSGFNGGFGVGTNDHAHGNDYNLVEDVWIWAKGQRIIAINYRAHNNVWRRVLVRGDGCGTSACTGSGNPNVGITIYDSHDVSFQNVMVIDRILAAGDESYADFASAQHTPDPALYFGRNEWLGAISIGAPDAGWYVEPDDVLDPTYRIENVVAWNAKGLGLNLARKGLNISASYITTKVANSQAQGIRIASPVSGTLSDLVVLGVGNWGINSTITPVRATVAGTFSSNYNQTTCSVGCSTTAPTFASILAVPGGAQVTRYGVDGSRMGETGYNVKTNAPLLPWPNEARIKAEMCKTVTRGFCGAASISDYIGAQR